MSNAAPNTETEAWMKVWRPQGFAGVEVERFDNVRNFDIAPFVTAGHEFTVVHSSGDSQLSYERQSYRFECDEPVYMNQHAGAPCAVAPLDDELIDVWTVRLYPHALQQLKTDLGLGAEFSYLPEMIPSAELNPTLAKLTTETVLAFNDAASRLERESRLLGLIHVVLKHCSDTKPPELKLGKEHQAVALIKEVIQAHPEYDHTLDDLATLTKLNRYYLHEVFKRDVGLTPDQYQAGVRIHRVKDLLASGRAIAEIAYELGFSDQSHLNRVFKKYTQVTPGRFQQDSLRS